MGMTNELSYKICDKKRFKQYYYAVEQASFDEYLYQDKRKVYYCWDCASWHTSRETVKVDIGLLER